MMFENAGVGGPELFCICSDCVQLLFDCIPLRLESSHLSSCTMSSRIVRAVARHVLRSYAVRSAGFPRSLPFSGSRFISSGAAASAAAPSNAPPASAPPTPPVFSAEARDARAHPLLAAYQPLRDALYADRASDFFGLPVHTHTIADAFAHWRGGRLAEAEKALVNANDADPAVILALASVFQAQGRADEAKQVWLGLSR